MRSSDNSIDQHKNSCIAVIGGGISPEREISIKSAQNVFKSLKGLGLNAIELDPADPAFFTTQFDVAFNCLHGKWGEDGGLQGYCELKKIPYTGPGVLATSIGFNKPMFKSILLELGISVPRQITNKTDVPFIANPVSEGSSIGVSIIKNEEDWEAAIKKTPAVLTNEYFFEEYIVGKEITSGVIEINGEITILPILEIRSSNEFYDFDSKYTPGKTTFVIPAAIDPLLKETIERISKQIYRAFNCKGCIRIDMIIDKDGPKVLEMNTNPGLTELSDIPAQANAMGITFDELMIHYLNSAKY